MKTIGITGGTGFVGQHLSQQLIDAGHRVVILSRGKKSGVANIRYAHWQPDKMEIDTQALHELDAVVHLAGAGVTEQRWTDARKKEIMSSRVDATNFLVAQLRAHAPKCRTFIAASATGYYGPDRGSGAFREDDPPFDDFLAQVCVAWEAASLKAVPFYRTAIFRFGIVLGKEGGAYPELSRPMGFGIMPILGSGRQMVSWIHVTDVAGMLTAAVGQDAYAGIYNAVTQQPVSHRALMKAIAHAKGGLKIPAPVPPFLLRIVMGEASVEVLKSCTVSSEKAEAAGFRFRYPGIEAAVATLVHGSTDENP